MSTRAVYMFKDKSDAFVVYKHYDGYPTGAAEFIQAARKRAWQGGRFEADEAAASFVAAAKGELPGGVRLVHGNTFANAPSDIAFAYVITQGPEDWEVECLSPSFKDDKMTSKRLFKGTIAAFTEWASKSKYG